jgi:hypothetical protein
LEYCIDIGVFTTRFADTDDYNNYTYSSESPRELFGKKLQPGQKFPLKSRFFYEDFLCLIVAHLEKVPDEFRSV